ncbi:MAG: DNA gyrase inhibitor YacG [Pseudomonadota bacterium]
MTDAAKPVDGAACPICGKPRAPRYRPFCSKRCADVDLARWFSGSYAIPAEEPADEEDFAIARIGAGEGTATDDDEGTAH